MTEVAVIAAIAVLLLSRARAPGARLSRHFTEADLTTTGTGLPNELPRALRGNARKLGAVLDQIHDASGGIRVTSGYRSPAVNAAIPGSAQHSHHMHALAADFQSTRGMAPAGLRQLVSDLELPLSELISYPSHLHIAVRQ